MTTKRFTSREQIIAKIDKFTAKAERVRVEQRACYEDGKRTREAAHKYNDSAMLHASNRFNSRGDAIGKKAERIEVKVLGSLKRKLAEFDTQTIPGITDDKTVEGI